MLDPIAPLRLAKVLRERKNKEGSFLALAKAIHKVYTDAGGRQVSGAHVVDRRKLTALVDTLEKPKSNPMLSLQELRALDLYLERFGEGLAYKPLFAKPGILAALAESNRTAFLLGSTEEKDTYRVNISHWDVLAMAEIQRGVNNLSDHVAFETHDVLLRDDVRNARRSITSSSLKRLLGEQGPSLVCFGSSRAIPAAEAMLCTMFDVPAFREPPATADKRRLPFHFIWRSGLAHVLPSRFHLSADDIVSFDSLAAKTVRSEGASAFEFQGRVLIDEVSHRRRGATYGVCVAQRRKRGQVWLVLAGVSGPATLATAQLVKSIATDLQHQGGESPITWTVTQATVRPDRTRRAGSYYDVTGQRILSGPHRWEPE